MPLTDTLNTLAGVVPLLVRTFDHLIHLGDESSLSLADEVLAILGRESYAMQVQQLEEAKLQALLRQRLPGAATGGDG